MGNEPFDLQRVLAEITTRNPSYVRLEAARKLGQVSASSAEAARALAVAATLDENLEVRSAALLALQAPVHQAFLKDHPGFIEESEQAAARDRELERQRKAREERSAEVLIMDEFLRRRRRERRYYLFLFAGLVIPVCVTAAGLLDWVTMGMVRGWLIYVVASAVVVSFLSLRNWRCPACDSWLGGFSVTINPWWAAQDVRCPRCGKRLL